MEKKAKGIKDTGHKKISYTALLCARSLAEHTKIKYANELFTTLTKLGYGLPKNLSYSTGFLFSRFFKGLKLLHCFLEARYLSTEETLKKLKHPYILEIAAGLSPRGIDYPGLYIESDLRKIISIKSKILKDMHKKRENHKLVELNILDRKQLFKIGNIYLNSDQKRPLAIIHAGLWTYLTKKEQILMRDNTKDFLERFCKKGYWLSSDFRPKSLQKNNFFRFFRKKITKQTGRGPTRFRSDKDLIKFMKEGGFKVKIISNKKIIKNLNCKKKFNLTYSEIIKQTLGLKVYIMQLK